MTKPGPTRSAAPARSTTAPTITSADCNVLLAEAGPTVGMAVTAKLLGIHPKTAYDLAARGELGVPVLRLGRKLRVPTAELKRVLGLVEQRGGGAA